MQPLDKSAVSVEKKDTVEIKVGVDVPYFTTEDDVPMYYKDIYWCVDTFNGKIFSCQAVSEFETDGKNTFSTKELAEAYLRFILSTKDHWTDTLVKDFINKYKR